MAGPDPQPDKSPGPDPGPNRDPGTNRDSGLTFESAVSDAGRVLGQQATAAKVVDGMRPGPALAYWIDQIQAAELNGFEVSGATAACHRLASWAQAKELGFVAQTASRAAVSNQHIAVGPDGRPAQVPPEAAAEVALELRMSQFGAACWTDLAITLNWRLRGTAAALQDGVIDLTKARIMAEMTSVLSDTAARSVEEKILPTAGSKTPGQLKAALRRAVISEDPEAAELRRKQAERRARVELFADEQGTATLAGQNLPGTQAAAAMARICALAQAMKASGAGGGIDLLRAQVMIGLLLGTLPLIPPAEDAPPDPPSTDGGCRPGPGGGSSPEPTEPTEPSGPADPGFGSSSGPRRERASDQGKLIPPWPELPGPGDTPPGLSRSVTGALAGLPPGAAAAGLLTLTVPWRTLAGMSDEPGDLTRLGPITREAALDLAEAAALDPGVRWRVIVTDAAGRAIAITRVRSKRARSPGPGGHGQGLVSQVTLTVRRDLACSPPPEASWRPAAAGAPGSADVSGSGGVPVSVGAPAGTGGDLGALLAAALSAAAEAAEAAAEVDAEASGTAVNGRGPCAHRKSTPAYRPSQRLREFVVARDRTCRFPPCRQPAQRGDLDHTCPYHQGGRTCDCNLGAGCRTHHKIKGLPGWHLRQLEPGVFEWCTPAGRRYVVEPDPYPV
jgi:hypothetical protein